MVTASWNGKVIATSDDTVSLEGNHYFPPDSVNMDYFEESSSTSHCPFKGEARYHNLLVNGERNADAVWHYPDPKKSAGHIRGYYAFWKGVRVSE